MFFSKPNSTTLLRFEPFEQASCVLALRIKRNGGKEGNSIANCPLRLETLVFVFWNVYVYEWRMYMKHNVYTQWQELSELMELQFIVNANFDAWIIQSLHNLYRKLRTLKRP